MSLARLLDTKLPLNRKERYFTGTVLPMVVCRDNLRHLDRFLTLVPGYTERQIVINPDHATIQFFTEYSFVEAVFGRSRARFTHARLAKDTPDIMIYMEGPPSALVAIEAKMYDVPSAAELVVQMRRQRVILDYLHKELQIGEIHHAALLPEKLHQRLGMLPFPVVTWEAILDRYRSLDTGDYFTEVLAEALARYDELVARTGGGAHNERFRTGEEIYALHVERNPDVRIVGRSGGIWGRSLKHDIKSGKWRATRYETSSEDEPPNRNWFRVEDFVGLIENETSPSA